MRHTRKQEGRLRFTIGTGPSSDPSHRQLSLENDVRLLKAGLLYADRVKLCSVGSSLTLRMLADVKVPGWASGYSPARVARIEGTGVKETPRVTPGSMLLSPKRTIRRELVARGQGCRCLYSPRFLEGVFSETGLPASPN